MGVRTWIVAMALVAGLWPVAAIPGDGRIEISQASVDEAGGFPYTIRAPGSYVLTSDLVVASDVGAIAITTPGDVTLDLNGFHVTGSASCLLGSCAQGAAIGLSGPPSFGFGSNIAVFGGEVSKFSGSCIALGSSARVERMYVSRCGRNGIWVGGGGSVMNNLVISTGENGLLLEASSIYAHNSVRLPNLGGTGGLAIRGGTATAGNYCDDGSCSAEGEKRFYLTPALHPGSSAAAACTAGFHLAQLSEIWDPSSLHYDSVMGHTIAGETGAPMVNQGWIYGTDEDADCSNYTSSAGGGQIAMLTAISAEAQWIIVSIQCIAERRVWCVED